MTKVLNHKIIDYLDDFNSNYLKQHGYVFCRCYSCFLPIIFENYVLMRQCGLLPKILPDVIQAINNDYFYSADYKMGIRTISGLKCGNDCIYYEEKLEACPIAFWEIDKSNLQLFIKLLDDLYYIK